MYEQELCIRNNTSNLMKIKIYGPTSEYFSVKNSPVTETLSAGLSTKIKVYFSSQEMEDYYDVLKIVCEGTRVVR